jgi:hypothetical protein
MKTRARSSAAESMASTAVHSGPCNGRHTKSHKCKSENVKTFYVGLLKPPAASISVTKNTCTGDSNSSRHHEA